jgi:hypothetical protein
MSVRGRPGTKYGNRKVMYRKCLYDSVKESEYAMQLDSDVFDGKIRGWKRQVTLALIVDDHHICNAIVDFMVMHKDGSIEYVEVKGYPTDVWKMKRKLIEALYPEIRYTVR